MNEKGSSVILIIHCPHFQVILSTLALGANAQLGRDATAKATLDIGVDVTRAILKNFDPALWGNDARILPALSIGLEALEALQQGFPNLQTSQEGPKAPAPIVPAALPAVAPAAPAVVYAATPRYADAPVPVAAPLAGAYNGVFLG